MNGQDHGSHYEARLLRIDDLRRAAADASRAHEAAGSRRVRRDREQAEGRVARLRTRWVRAA